MSQVPFGTGNFLDALSSARVNAIYKAKWKCFVSSRMGPQGAIMECHLSQAKTTGQRPLPVEEVMKSWPLIC